jgi:AcrR family transcriptional regulator
MKTDAPRASARSRGRPPSGSKLQIAERLREATNLLLQTHSHFDLTEHKIAEVAGTDKSMIHYYFGSKDELLFDLIKNLTDEIRDRVKAMNFFDPISARHITRQTFKLLTEIYYTRPWLTRVLMAELTRDDSIIRKLYLARCGPRGLGEEPIRRLVVKLVEMGIYDKRINIEYATTSILFVIVAPLMMAQFPLNFVMALDDYRKDGWIDHLTDLFDRQLRAPAPELP